MPRSTSRFARLGTAIAGLVLAIVGLLGGFGAAPATAAHEEVNDPAGDAGFFLACRDVAAGSPCDGTVVSQDAVDILTGDLSTQAKSLSLTMTLLDADAPVGPAGSIDPDVHYEFVARTADLVVVLGATRGNAVGRAVVAREVPGAPLRETTTPVTFVGNTVRWDVPLPLLDGLRAQVCATCPSIGRGTLLRDLSLHAWSSGGLLLERWQDDATSDATYRIGDA